MSVFQQLGKLAKRAVVSGKRSSRRNPPTPSTGSAEILEVKQYPAAALMASLDANGLLRIEGTDRSDRIVVREASGQLSVDTIKIHTPRGMMTQLPSNAVSGINVMSLGGNDIVIMSVPDQAVTKPTRIDAGAGNDQVVGGAGNDLLYGSCGDDFLFGARGNDMLFGGRGSDRLYGGSGADRFLFQFGDGIADSSSADAKVTFADGDRRWSDAEILAVDEGLGWLQARTGNSRLLKLSNGQDLTFRRESVLQGNINILGDNDDRGQIRISDTLFRQHRSWIGATVVHEIGHNWDEQHENPFIREFRAQSGWVSTGMGQWQHATGATFSREYGRTNPYEDFATIMEAAYGLKPQQNVESKLAVVNRFLNAIRNNTAFASPAASVASATPRLPLASITMNREIQSVVTVSNTTRLSISYYIAWPGQSWSTFSLRPGQSMIHATKDPRQQNIAPLISFDNSSRQGYQETRGLLTSKFYVVSPSEGWGAPSQRTDGMLWNFVANASQTSLSIQMDNRMDTARRSQDRMSVTSLRAFPRLGSNFEVIGAATGRGPADGGDGRGVYNCIAWTLGVTTQWVWSSEWQGTGENGLRSMDRLYGQLGYTRLSTADYSLQSGLQKVAVYATLRAGTYGGEINSMTHGALQEADGTWTSKLGGQALIRHATPNCVNGSSSKVDYGVPVAVYARRTNYGWNSASVAPGRGDQFKPGTPATRNMTTLETPPSTPKSLLRQKQVAVAATASDMTGLTTLEKRAARSEQRSLAASLDGIDEGTGSPLRSFSGKSARDLTSSESSLDEALLDAVMSDLKDVMMAI